MTSQLRVNPETGKPEDHKDDCTCAQCTNLQILAKRRIPEGHSILFPEGKLPSFNEAFKNANYKGDLCTPSPPPEFSEVPPPLSPKLDGFYFDDISELHVESIASLESKNSKDPETGLPFNYWSAGGNQKLPWLDKASITDVQLPSISNAEEKIEVSSFEEAVLDPLLIQCQETVDQSATESSNEAIPTIPKVETEPTPYARQCEEPGPSSSTDAPSVPETPVYIIKSRKPRIIRPSSYTFQINDGRMFVVSDQLWAKALLKQDVLESAKVLFRDLFREEIAKGATWSGVNYKGSNPNHLALNTEKFWAIIRCALWIHSTRGKKNPYIFLTEEVQQMDIPPEVIPRAVRIIAREERNTIKNHL